MKDRLGLTTITRLLPVITSLTLHIETVLALLVLCHLVKCMLLAVLAFTKGLLGLGNVHLHPSTTAKTNIQKAGRSTTSTKPNMNSLF
jgi:hypothetical protein